MDTKQYVLHELEMTADWRSRKADEHPEDERNTEAAKLARKLADELRALPSDSNQLRALDREYDADVHSYAGEALNRYFGRLGFDHWPENAAELLKEYSEIMSRERTEGAVRSEDHPSYDVDRSTLAQLERAIHDDVSAALDAIQSHDIHELPGAAEKLPAIAAQARALALWLRKHCGSGSDDAGT